ncbi:MAG: NUDIX domain-containing protein [Prevotella sp.]|nr:NUDIX domain-containing protein [Prevotella sp.]
MHPLDKFACCPACGSKDFTEHNEKSKQCGSCGFVYYANPSAATAAFILNSKGELLVVRRGKEPAKGTLDLPGGFVDMDENAEEGMLREIEEETGLKLNEPKYLFSIPNLYEYSGMTIHTLDMFFRLDIADDCMATAADDAAEAMWMPLNMVDETQFGLQSISQAVKRFLDANR